MITPFTPEQISKFFAGFPLPAEIEINEAETVTDLPLYISTQCTRMQCGCRILEQIAAERMEAMAKQLTLSNETT
jgi:hypothetical protein